MYPQPDQPDFGTFVKDQVDALRLLGVEVDVLFIDGRKHRINYLWGPFRVWWYLLRGRYDLIHAHYVFSGIMARLQPFLPVVVTYHGSELGVKPDHWLSRLSRKVSRLFQQVIVVAPHMKALLDGSNVTIIPCGIDLDKIKPLPVSQARQQLRLGLDKPLMVWVGDPKRVEKRFGLMEEAANLVKQRVPDAELVLVSGQPHDTVPVYMSACDVLGLTSIHEGSPMVIKEAMACNLPIVSVDVGDVAAVIGGTEHCYLVEPEPDAVAEKLSLLLSDRQRTHGRSSIAALGSDAIAARIVEVYHRLCKS
jgi:glycosyltransferase involved in cell wall biosynthesis